MTKMRKHAFVLVRRVQSLLRGANSKNNGHNACKRRSADRRNLISRRAAVYASYLRTLKTHAVCERARYHRHQIYISLGKEPTGAWLTKAADGRESRGARVRRIHSRERKTAIIINNSTAQRHPSTMEVLLKEKWQR